MTETNPARTRAVLGLVLREREAQEARYGEANKRLADGTGPEVRWLGPYTGDSAVQIQKQLRMDYEDFEAEVGLPTWLHLVREELAEVAEASSPELLATELIQVAALCVSWVERLPGALRCPSCGTDGLGLCQDCIEAML